MNTPIKRYSSGMNVRLAFSVAAHLETEILLVDEVLAVGDVAFQRKCLGKMEDAAGQGRIVLFVSHNMATILSICSSAYLLDRGRIIAAGSVGEVVETHLERMATTEASQLSMRSRSNGNGKARITSIKIENGDGNKVIRCSDRLKISINYEAKTDLANVQFLVSLYDESHRRIFQFDSGTTGGLPAHLPKAGIISCITSPINLTPGRCIVNAAIMVRGEMADHLVRVHSFDVEEEDFFGTGRLSNRETSLSLLHQTWKLDRRVFG